MYEPIRGGTRGGQAEFKWKDVAADKDREHYLGHSINAPAGRWQKNKDIHWYNRDTNPGESERQAEIRRIKEAEEEALSIALGFAPAKKSVDTVTNTGEPSVSPTTAIPDEEQKRKEKEERKQRKLEKKARKAEKKARKEAKRRGREDSSDSERERYKQGIRRREGRSRSRSPRHRTTSPDMRDTYRRHSASPRRLLRRSRTPPYRDDHRGRGEYGILNMERERERDRRRWEENAKRNLPGGV